MTRRPACPSWALPLRRARWLQGFGGLVLAVSCLFPAVDGCGAPYVPAKEIWDMFRNPNGFSEEWLLPIWIGMPYLIGLAFCGIVLRWRGTLLHRQRCLGTTVVWLIIVWVSTVTCLLVRSLIEDGYGSFDDPAMAMHAFVCVCSLIYLPSAIRNQRAGKLCIRWYAVVCCIFWFGGWFVGETASGSSTYYGLWISLVGAILIVAGAFLEAKLVSLAASVETLIGLLTCRLRVVDPDEPRCTVCGYLLQGLPTNRCPECGTPFAPLDPSPFQ